VKQEVNSAGAQNGANGFVLPGMFGALAEQGIARTQEGCVRVKLVSEHLAEALRETYVANAESATSYGLKVINISNANTAAAMDFCVRLLGSKSATDVFALSAAQARKTLDTTSAQSSELWNLAQKLATEVGEPVRKHVARIFHQPS
jgi:hypothetical protein